MSSLSIRTARAVIWFTRVQEGSMTEGRMHLLKRWLALPANTDAFESMRAAWHNSPPIKRGAWGQSSSHKSTGTFELSRSPQRSIPEHSPSFNGVGVARVFGRSGQLAERVRLVSQEAAYWYFLCVDDPSMLPSDRREFLAWMRRSPENIAELFKTAQLDGELRRLRLAIRSLGMTKSNVIELTTSRSPYGLHRQIQQLDTDEGKGSVKSERTLPFKLAASAALLFFGVALAFIAQDYLQSEQIVTTGASQWHHMMLPDGTAVHIDARSRLEAAYTNEERIVHVYGGSAVFDVVKDPKRPFIARTDLVDVTAVGTRFGVSIDPGVTTTVSEGAVRVTGRGRPDGKAVVVSAGEELHVSDSLLTAPHPAHVDAERKLQWANGVLVLSGLTVTQGIQELNRRNRVQILLDSPTLGARVVRFANVRVDSPETYAEVIAQEAGINVIFDKESGVIRLSE